MSPLPITNELYGKKCGRALLRLPEILIICQGFCKVYIEIYKCSNGKFQCILIHLKFIIALLKFLSNFDYIIIIIMLTTMVRRKTHLLFVERGGENVH